MTTPCTQGDRLARIEDKLDAVVHRLGHPGDPLTGAPPQGLVAIVLEQRDVASRVSALESHNVDSAARRKALLANAAKIVIPLLFGAGIAKADAIIGVAMAMMR